ncbi:PDGLE domain-containing protein [Desulfosporosinus sp. FKB]|uniref:PDGLE domain-containing protein n=1 Tax=Desulfosporosinus sp. FKB TaxID=1969835 RepID=UPI001FA83882|nr:PDGLE domain-containing protein [Desulfosporosinus sp. FKB]
MLFAHLTVAGPVEAVVNALVIAYLQRSSPALLELRNKSQSMNASYRIRNFVIGLLVMAVLTPLGLLASGTAWGEWGGEDLQSQLGFIPSGLQKFSDFWHHTILPDYGITGFDQTFWQQALGYLLSAFVGLLVIGFIAVIVQRLVLKHESQKN